MSAAELFGWVLFSASCLALAGCGWCFYAFVICPERDRSAEDWMLADLREELERVKEEQA